MTLDLKADEANVEPDRWTVERVTACLVSPSIGFKGWILGRGSEPRTVVPLTVHLQIYGLRKKDRTKMGNRDYRSEKEKGKISLMIADVTRQLAKLPLYRLKLQNTEVVLEVASVSSSSTQCVADRISDG
uniref:Uncharacterized protein n=1 Tax=Solanum tuberosum TaxID=4113 RepID=M1DJT4_SOLTU